MINRKTFLLGGLILALAAAALGVLFAKSWYLSLAVLCGGTILMFFSVFENKAAAVEKTVLLAVLSASAAAGRALFVLMPPSVQPASFIIILTGMAFGAEAGFITGAMTALVSSLFLGMGPWTMWQMFAWGLMGLTSGLMGALLRKNRILRVAFAFVWGILFGWIMDIYALVSMGSGSGFGYVLAIYAQSFVFDLLHGATNAILIFFGGERIMRTLDRVAVKYGLRRGR
ncbi:MAG: ECF transporter S component [Defluviitaleaceae bacterium]|nr:ECF transporter S component [Defluviitaleaceae bacterium]